MNTDTYEAKHPEELEVMSAEVTQELEDNIQSTFGDPVDDIYQSKPGC